LRLTEECPHVTNPAGLRRLFLGGALLHLGSHALMKSQDFVLLVIIIPSSSWRRRHRDARVL
jgi:hypothetical protein